MEIELNMTSSPGKDGSNWPAFPFWILGGILMYVLSSGPYMMAEQKGLAAAPVLQTSGKLSAGANLNQAGATLINTSFTTELGLK